MGDILAVVAVHKVGKELPLVLQVELAYHTVVGRAGYQEDKEQRGKLHNHQEHQLVGRACSRVGAHMDSEH